MIERLANTGSALAGTAEQIIRHMQSYVQAGAEELMLQWPDFDDLAGLRAFATEVLPRL